MKILHLQWKFNLYSLKLWKISVRKNIISFLSSSLLHSTFCRFIASVSKNNCSFDAFSKNLRKKRARKWKPCGSTVLYIIWFNNWFDTIEAARVGTKSSSHLHWTLNNTNVQMGLFSRCYLQGGAMNKPHIMLFTQPLQSTWSSGCNSENRVGLTLHQSTAASTWWCSPQPRLGWEKMAVGLYEGPSYPRHSPRIIFCCAVPRTTAERQYTAFLKSVECLLLSPAFFMPVFVSSFFFFSWWAVTFIPTLHPSFLAQCALEMWPGGISQCNAVLAPNGHI